ncbi:OmpH family outer membrane protein [Salinimicrobium sp. MT39]|uniref:OmpH family outer membrane protein n=1 Tax=Salinimicrobium profundisediminis TaxID=2994553 RepID=A0A9X3CXA2_9FLAO|nr:OmpH family outer membrane protein [Salinimicrobium profundisediminis]MCX2837225.1 OmpH family outer membrane protein [Salinimicrobium profundisediminis]
MKKSILITLTFLLVSGFVVQAQQTVRIGYVDMEYILQNVPEYQEASAQLEKKVQQWKTEIETELQRVDKMKQDLANERPLLTNELIKDREDEIKFEEKKILDYQQKRFGPNGDFITQKLQLVKPVQDQVFVAVQEIAKNRNYDLIFDKSADVVTLFAADRLDVSDQVLRSITRASNRKELETRQEKRELIRQEAKTVEEDAVLSEREQLQQERKQEREALLEKRRQERDSIRNAKKEEAERRREAILKERQRKKDSIAKAREEIRNN